MVIPEGNQLSYEEIKESANQSLERHAIPGLVFGINMYYEKAGRE